jgi:hypothetical protein
MRKITMTLAAAVFVVGSMAIANAQTQGASSLNAQAKNATIIHQAACNGFWGRGARRAVTACAARIAAGALPAGKQALGAELTVRPPPWAASFLPRHCEERSDEPIHAGALN